MALMTGMAYVSNPVDSKDRRATLPVDRQISSAGGRPNQCTKSLSSEDNFEYIDLGKDKNNDLPTRSDFK
ncbi:MAG: hypothetical protein NPIRA06_12320 [Nitrospirales bacterium]|nr:MAG: hypothetical protein NPIRA06_12320 [Nitrospirales bacterium]